MSARGARARDAPRRRQHRAPPRDPMRKQSGANTRLASKSVQGDLGLPRGCCCMVRAQCGTFMMFLVMLPGEEPHCKPLWEVFPNADGWYTHAFG